MLTFSLTIKIKIWWTEGIVGKAIGADRLPSSVRRSACMIFEPFLGVFNFLLAICVN